MHLDSFDKFEKSINLWEWQNVTEFDVIGIDSWEETTWTIMRIVYIIHTVHDVTLIRR